MADVVPLLERVIRYGLVGVVNAVVGLGLIVLLDLGLHVRPELANAAGYGAGVLVSFALTRVFVFRNSAAVAKTGPRYLLVVAAAFVMNQLALISMLHVIGPGSFQHALAQLTGIATYTGFVFLACQLWVFREGTAASPESARQ